MKTAIAVIVLRFIFLSLSEENLPRPASYYPTNRDPGEFLPAGHANLPARDHKRPGSRRHNRGLERRERAAPAQNRADEPRLHPCCPGIEYRIGARRPSL